MLLVRSVHSIHCKSSTLYLAMSPIYIYVVLLVSSVHAIIQGDSKKAPKVKGCNFACVSIFLMKFRYVILISI